LYAVALPDTEDTVRAFLCFAFVALILATTAPASALYCERRIVSDGDTPDRVLSLCGEPASMDTRYGTHTELIYVRGVVVGSYMVTVRYDVWVYDFGPQRFMVELLFENGVLTRENTLGYGTARR